MEQKHMENTRLLPDRIALLHQLPKGCVTCEVGVAFGGFSEKILEIVRPSRHFLIDSWMHQGRYDDRAFVEVLKKFKTGLRSGQVSLIRADSVAGIHDLPGAGIDFIYIDTSHEYGATKQELAAARDKMTPTGLIAGHDYVAGNFNHELNRYIPYGVVRAVGEFMEKHDYALYYLTLEETGPYSFALRKNIPT